MTTEHQGLPVHGHQPQEDARIRLINENKIYEERLLRTLDGMLLIPGEFDARWVAIARTHFEQGFMAMNRAVARTPRIKLEGDELIYPLNPGF